MPDQIKYRKPAKRPRFDRLRRWIRGALLALALVVIIWHLWVLAQLLQWRSEYPEMSAFMQQSLEVLQEKNPNAKLSHMPVPYSRISHNLKRAVIAAEDATFVEHSGFDWEGIQNALEKNIEKGRFAAGGSTISQQLAKNLFLSGDRSLLRKGEEAIITVMIETTLSKHRILELYLNYAEWGRGIYGAEAAARHHFGIPASMLSSWQAARLAAILPNPRFYDRRSTDWIDRKIEIIQERMAKVRIPR
ncbi:monofunctional biosynthetic peptidoglycan transglycosylase [Mariprofundus ferrinatatus]|uniref:Biosynthetic peptidoglycan transglycosylase n=2 Tax=Mariprofundus ferrinatatus TaxID=1921087 RepID=A0A2K8L8W6_9PROT|nr:monofunctional biosynthetic peptidoglycan transglycosylase [Mariprofundus ferrinatatus]